MLLLQDLLIISSINMDFWFWVNHIKIQLPYKKNLNFTAYILNQVHQA